ncbi:MAG: D-alanyl-D-alanine carboxypeptidase family protein [Stellaceae bacterium]
MTVFRVPSFRFLAAAIFPVILAGALTGGAPSALAAKHSSIVIDAKTGQVLSESNADAVTYPASLTKMMTLYLTFDALEHKQVTLDQHFPVSAHAAAQEPTKLDLKAGDTIAVHDLILGIVTQSANDAAVVLAEGLGGTEHAFAEKMTRTARAMGMEHTNFDNASGLPDPLQRTTARDMAMLARHLYLDFPGEYKYFGTEEFTYHGVTYGNHNHLMNSFRGMDGIKTGFIRASGFNLAASAVRDHRRLIGVVMGGQSAHSRDRKMASLLNAVFAGHTAPETQMVASNAKPAAKRGQGESTLHVLAHHAAHAVATLSPIGQAEAATPMRKPNASWGVQVGAYRRQASAAHAGAVALSHLPAERGKTVVLVASHSKKHTIYQARIINLTEKQASNACRVLRRGHRACVVLEPSMQMAASPAASKNLAE